MKIDFTPGELRVAIDALSQLDERHERMGINNYECLLDRLVGIQEGVERQERLKEGLEQTGRYLAEQTRNPL